LWRLALDPARLAAVASSQGIPASDEDHGYTGHALLCGLFGKDRAPKPWLLDGRKGVLWAYSPTPLAASNYEFADPLYHAAVRWDESASKPMPPLKAGRQIGWDLRACPVVRQGARHGSESPGTQKTKASEHDYLLWVAKRDGVLANSVDAAAVYAIWLKERAWPATAGATLDSITVDGWQKPAKNGSNAWRGRGDGRLRLPDVHFSGVLTVTDPEAFTAQMARGVGRHRAFGFGMLLLRSLAG